jgi:hypothetical protein
MGDGTAQGGRLLCKQDSGGSVTHILHHMKADLARMPAPFRGCGLP